MALRLLRRLLGAAILLLFFPALLPAQSHRAYVASNNCLQMYDTNGPIKTVNLPRPMMPRSVAVSPDNRFVYVADMGYYGGDVLVYQAESLNLLTSIPGTNMTSEIAFLPDSSAAYLVLWTGPYPGLKIVSIATHTVTQYLPELDGCPYGIAMAPDGRHAYAALGWGWLAPIDTATRTLEPRVWFDPPGYFPPYSGYPSWGLAVTPDGQRAYVPNQDGVVFVVDTVSRSIVARIDMGCCDGYQTDEAAASPDGRSIYITRSARNTVTVLDTATNTIRRHFTNVGGSPFGIGLTRNGRYAFVASRGNGVYLIDTLTNTFRPLGTGACSGHLSVAVAPESSAPPVAICTNVSVPAGPMCQSPASVNNGSFDPDGDPLTLVQTPAGPYRPGATAVQLTVTDLSGASATCSATVNVYDASPPVLTVPPSITVNAESPAGALLNDVMLGASATDNCAVATLTHTPAGYQFPIGSTTVTYTARDAAGNAASAVQTVRVLGAAEQLATLAAAVALLPGEWKNSLASKVENAMASLGRNHNAACNQLGVFLNEVAAQTGKKINPVEAQGLIAMATRIRAVLGC